VIPPADDIDRIMAVMSQAFDPQFGEAWNRRQVEDALLLGNCHYALVDMEGQLPASGADAAGFSLSRYGFEEEELLLFAVVPQYRCRGLGARLLADLTFAARERGARRLLLEMRRSNPAESLYRSFGFQPIGERPNYYKMMDGTRIDAVTFALAVE
jgi:ribosomal-protein-alanine N-acetyltransferase